MCSDRTEARFLGSHLAPARRSALPLNTSMYAVVVQGIPMQLPSCSMLTGCLGGATEAASKMSALVVSVYPVEVFAAIWVGLQVLPGPM